MALVAQVLALQAEPLEQDRQTPGKKKAGITVAGLQLQPWKVETGEAKGFSGQLVKANGESQDQ